MNDTFDFKDFVLSLLRRWRLFVVCILLFGLLGAGARGLLNLRADAGADDPDKNQPQFQYEQLEQQEKNIQQQVDKQQQYLTNSILVNLDAHHLQTCEVILTLTPRRAISTQAEVFQLQSDAVALGETLRGALQEDAVIDQIMAALALEQLDRDYVKELITVETQKETASLTLTVLYDTQEGAAQIAKICNEAVERTFAQAQTLSSNYLLNQVSQRAFEGYSTEHNQLRVNAEYVLTVLQDALTKVQGQLDDLSSQVPSGNTAAFVKYAIFGAAGGAVIALLLTFFLDIMDPRIRSVGQVGKELNIRVIGTLEPDDRKKGEHHV